MASGSYPPSQPEERGDGWVVKYLILRALLLLLPLLLLLFVADRTPSPSTAAPFIPHMHAAPLRAS